MSEDLVLAYKDNNSQRTPCVLVLDGSKSMDGQPIDELNRGLQVLEAELKEDVMARSRVRLLVIRVGGTPSILGDWTDAIEFEAPTLEASGNTPLGEAMELALQSVAEEKQRLDTAGISSTRPWIFMISDGAPTDPGWQMAAESCVQAENAKRVAVFPMAFRGPTCRRWVGSRREARPTSTVSGSPISFSGSAAASRRHRRAVRMRTSSFRPSIGQRRRPEGRPGWRMRR